MQDVRRLVGPTADRLRAQVRAVGLDEEPIRRAPRPPPRAGHRPSGTSRSRRTRRSTRARAPSGAAPATRSSGGRPCPRSPRAPQPSRSPPRGCGSRREVEARSASSSWASKSRRWSAGVACSRTLSSPVSPTATAFELASSSRSSSTRSASALEAWCGSMPRTAYTPSCRSASSSAARDESIPVPMVTILVTPALTRVRDGRLRVLAPVEVRVRVGHASSGSSAGPPALASMRRSSSGTTFSGSSLMKSDAGSRRACPAGIVLGAQAPSHAA